MILPTTSGTAALATAPAAAPGSRSSRSFCHAPETTSRGTQLAPVQRGDDFPHPPRVRRPRRCIQVPLQLRDRLLDPPDPGQQQAAIPHLPRRPGPEQQDPVDHRERPAVVPGVQVDPLQVHEQPDQDVLLPDRPQILRLHADHAAVHPIQELLRLILELDPPAFERIDQDPQRLAFVANQEMPRESHPDQRQPEPPTDFEIDHAQRDRDSEPAVEDIVQEGVPHIVVRLDVAPETLLLEQNPVQFLEYDERRGFVAEPVVDPLGPEVELPQIRPQLELRILLGRDQERARRQVQLRLGGGRQRCEALPDRRRRLVHPFLDERNSSAIRSGSASSSRAMRWNSAVLAAFGSDTSTSSPPSWGRKTTVMRKPWTPVARRPTRSTV